MICEDGWDRCDVPTDCVEDVEGMQVKLGREDCLINARKSFGNLV